MTDHRDTTPLDRQITWCLECGRQQLISIVPRPLHDVVTEALIDPPAEPEPEPPKSVQPNIDPRTIKRFRFAGCEIEVGGPLFTFEFWYALMLGLLLGLVFGWCAAMKTKDALKDLM